MESFLCKVIQHQYQSISLKNGEIYESENGEEKFVPCHRKNAYLAAMSVMAMSDNDWEMLEEDLILVLFSLFLTFLFF